ncbi:MAG: universal stress protein [Streptosporangiaceae bacterium]
MDQAEQPGPDPRAARRPRSASLLHPVVVGYDGSASSRHALAYAAGMGRRLGRPLLVAYVTPSGVSLKRLTGQRTGQLTGQRTGRRTGQLAELPRDAGAVPRWLLADLADVADVAELEVHVRTCRGCPARELAALAAELDADALVTGAPMRLRHRLAGSVPGWLARHASCPVIVVP